MQDATTESPPEWQPANSENSHPSPDLPISELQLGSRARNVLNAAGITTAGAALEALEQGDKALTGLKGFGAKSLTSLKNQLREQGFSLPGEVTPFAVPAETPESLAPAETAPVEIPEPPTPTETVPAEIAGEEAIVEETAPPETEPISAVETVPVAEAATLVERPTLGQQLREMLAPTLERLDATFAPLRARFGDRVGVYGLGAVVVVVILILALFVPPFSLLQRLGIVGFTTVNAQHPEIEHPDGLTLGVDPETFEGKLRVRLESVPREDFIGYAHSSLREAAESLPEHLEVKSPFYKVRVRGKSDQPVMLDAVMPNNAEPWETLDLYTWTGETWEWVGSELHTDVAEHEFIRARVTDWPDNVVVVQAGAPQQTVSTLLEGGDTTDAVTMLDEINPTGLALGTDGEFIGEPISLPSPADTATYRVMPALSDHTPGQAAVHGPLSDVLTRSEIQQAHIERIVKLCVERGFAGIQIDYQGVLAEEREAFADFVQSLADALHEKDLRLNVVVAAPTPTDGQWDTGGYDLAAIGAAADVVKLPVPQDPTAYAPSGETRRLLDWATGQVPRQKLHLLVSSLSVEQGSAGSKTITLEEALAPFGEVITIGGADRVASNSEVKFGLSGTSAIRGIVPHEAAGTYRIEYQAEDETSRTVWLGTASNLATKLAWAQRYHLGGVAVTGLLDPGNAPGVRDVVAAYRASSTPPSTQGLDVTWSVTSEAALVDQQTSPLTDPGYTWLVMAADDTYTVKASIGGYDHGSVQITVAELAPEPAAPEPAAEAPPAAAEGGGSETLDECLDTAYVADVTIPDNTQLDNGEAFEKTWRVRNNGTCAWPADTVLAFSSGAQMDALASVEVGAAEPGEEVEVTVEMKAPAEAASYSGVWRMQTAAGFFGGNLSVVILAGDVAPAVVSAVAPVSGGGFELGGHVRDLAMPYANQMHNAGMNWAKVQLRYPADASGIVAAAHAKGFKIQVSALGSANMVTQAGFEQQVASWVAGIAAAGADAIEVWNEPNIDAEWAVGHISPQSYTNLLCAAYSAIKGANPNTAVISAATAPTGYFGGCGPNGCDDLPFLQGMYNAGAANCMDYVGAHHNAGATSPSARSGHPADDGNHHHSWYFLPQTELYYNTFGGTRKLFYTEMGYASQEGLPSFSDHFGWARGINNAQQAAWLSEAVRLGINTGMVRCIIVWNIDFARYGVDPQDGYAIIRPGGSCPACDALHNVLGSR